MTIGIKISAKRFPRVLAKIQPKVRDSVLRAYHDAADFGVAAIQRTIAATDPQPVATGTYRNSWRALKHDKGAVIENTTKQAYFVEKGRRRGKRPPLAPILQWLRVKRIGKDDRKRRALAFMIQRKIGKKGTSKREVMKRTLPVIQAYLSRKLGREVKLTKPPR